jgi:HEPN domain-containing protein
MAKKEIEFLKEKAKKFYSNVKDLFKKGDYDLCVFNLEQSCQLYIKYLIAKKVGDWPKTHYLEALIKRLSEAYDKREIYDYFLENELFFDDLTDAYFTTRYIPKVFNKSLAEKLIEGYQKFLKFLEKTINEKFNSNK